MRDDVLLQQLHVVVTAHISPAGGAAHTFKILDETTTSHYITHDALYTLA